MKKFILSTLFIVFSWPALADDVRISFSNTENIEIFAKNPDPSGQWCADDIEINLGSSNPQADFQSPIILEVIKKVGSAVIAPSCPTANRVIVYQKNSGKKLGASTKINQWALVRDTQTSGSDNQETETSQESNNTNIPSLKSCDLSVDCYKNAINAYGEIVGKIISFLGRGLGILLFGLSLLMTPVRDRRFKTGYKGNATTDSSGSLGGTAIVIFLVCEALGYLARNYGFIISCIILSLVFLIIFAFIISFINTDSRSNSNNLHEESSKNQATVCSFDERNAIAQALVEGLKFAGAKDIIELNGSTKLAEFSLDGLTTKKERQLLADKMARYVEATNEDREIYIDEWYFDVPTSVAEDPLTVTIWFGGHKKDKDGQKVPRGLLMFGGRDNYKGRAKPTDKWLPPPRPELPKLPYQPNDIIVANLGFGAVCYFAVYYVDDDGYYCDVKIDDKHYYNGIDNADVLGLSKIKEVSEIFHGEPLRITEEELPDYLDQDAINNYQKRKSAIENHK